MIGNVASIIVRSGDTGCSASLIESIRQLGVLRPILVTRERVLLAGLRRLNACKALGILTIPTILK